MGGHLGGERRRNVVIVAVGQAFGHGQLQPLLAILGEEIGLDIALDEGGRPWILEVNTLPGIYAFGHLDKEGYRKIKRYAIAYGRLPSPKTQKSKIKKTASKVRATAAKRRTPK